MIALTLRLDDDMHEALRRESFERRVPINQIIRERIDAAAEPQGEPSSEVPEPSADTCEHCGRSDGNHMLIEPRLTIKLAPEPQGEPSDALTARAKAQVIADAMEEVMAHPKRGAWLILRDIADAYRAESEGMTVDTDPSADEHRDLIGFLRENATELGIVAELQGEPSEKRILVAVDAFMNSMMESEDGPSLVHKNMAAALRAAGGVR